ncbi:hypothetical protein DL95DRAFT_322203 [Leptodontidium sp. 2 PMI_412]|nr:hypothetical protein DL95DRAFT_322203 [Leptodontidium sp. 2 PMI_412]
MSQPVLRHLRRVPAFWRRPSDDTDEAPSSSTDSGTPQKVRSVLRVLLKNPWDDYSYIRHLGRTTLTLRKASSFHLADIREVSPFEVLGDPPILPQIKHPNIATIEEIYCYDDRIFLVVEHLDVSFAHLDFQKYDLEEREIATILFEVLKGVAYVSSLRLSCRVLSQENIWLSLDGDIKLGWFFPHLPHSLY